VTPSRSHLVAAVLLALGGMLAGVAASVIVIASLAVRAGIEVLPADALLLDDLVALLPLIVAFIVLDLAISSGLASGRPWAVVAASLMALGAVAMGAIGLLLVVLGNDPSLVTGAARASEADGIGLVAAFTGLYLTALIVLRVHGLPSGLSLRAAA
jgi:hypothetical protein